MNITISYRLFTGVLLLVAPLACAAAEHPLAWRKHELNREFHAEGGALGDLNRDGVDDVIAGPYWYEGPDFNRRHELYPPQAIDPLQYSKNFFAYLEDFDRDSWSDVLVIGFPGEETFWLRNPGETGDAWSRTSYSRRPTTSPQASSPCGPAASACCSA